MAKLEALTKRDLSRIVDLANATIPADDKVVWLVALAASMRGDAIPHTEAGFRRVTGYLGEVWVMDALERLRTRGLVTVSTDGFVAAKTTDLTLESEQETALGWLTMAEKGGLETMLSSAGLGFGLTWLDPATWVVDVGPEWTGADGIVQVAVVDQRFKVPEHRWLAVSDMGQALRHGASTWMAASKALGLKAESIELEIMVPGPHKLAPCVVRMANVIWAAKSR